MGSSLLTRFDERAGRTVLVFDGKIGHLNDQEGGLMDARRNIDAWWPMVEREEIEAIVMTASGCGVTVKEYGHILKDDPQYATKAKCISSLTRDLSELLPAVLPELAAKLQGRVNQPDTLYAYHPPCTLQHGQKLRGGVEVLDEALRTG